MSMCNKVSLGASGLGVVLVIIGAIVGFAVLPPYVNDQIKKNSKLEEGTEQYDRFIELSFPLDFKVSFFNVTNPDQIMDGKKPNVTEVGPYYYTKHSKKFDLIRDDRLGTIVYQNRAEFKFNPSKGGPNPRENKITILNVPLAVLIQTFEDFGDLAFLKNLLNSGYKDAFQIKNEKQPLFHTVTVEDYAFDTYKFCNADDIKSKAGRALCAVMRLMPSESLEVYDNRTIGFSFFKSKQNKVDGVYKINSGMKDVSFLGEIITWNNKDRLTNMWNDEGDCNKIQGTDSTIYPPFNTKDTEYYIYNTDICRTVKLKFKKEMEYEGVPGYRNLLSADNMKMSLDENKCYCIQQTRDLNGDKNCMPDGFLDMKHCLGAPIVVSLPHFLWADEAYANTVDGLQPVQDLHETYIDLEPNLGSPLSGAKRMQFNMILRKYKSLDPALNLPSAVVPLMWVEEAVALTDELVDDIKSKYLNQVKLVNVFRWTLIGLGIGFFIVFGALFFVRRNCLNNNNNSNDVVDAPVATRRRSTSEISDETPQQRSSVSSNSNSNKNAAATE